ncbi:hypothetical protein GMO_19670 [Gluconobacter morbifer G707]|uniref:Uncharacterized protein n=2 Tax=Gluconobacter TaxID=441 RepID=G6XKF1_9PROT|nr:hypothetical protein GMO_19670 [Gluconobacter morbifer G707]
MYFLDRTCLRDGRSGVWSRGVGSASVKIGLLDLAGARGVFLWKKIFHTADGQTDHF